jgi:hypothetical protein
MYGYLDESGAPGVAAHSNDFLAVSLVIFQNEQAVVTCSDAIARLRKRLKLHDNYEFHRSHNSRATQTAFIQLMRSLDFKFITVVIKKNGDRRHASYPRIAALLMREMAIHFTDGKIEMDANPILYAELRRNAKASKLTKIRFKEVKSHQNDLVQLADYVVSLSAARAKNLTASAENYRHIASKQLALVEIRI